MIRALFRPEPVDLRDMRRLTPKVMAELGVEPLDTLRKRLDKGRGTGAQTVHEKVDGTKRRAA